MQTNCNYILQKHFIKPMKCFSLPVFRRDHHEKSENIKIDKERSTEKVDGSVALVMALDRALKNQNGGSVYDDRELLCL